jgi:spore coat protein A, manganese oxidase
LARRRCAGLDAPLLGNASRLSFDDFATGPAKPGDDAERGPKDTVLMLPGTMTRIVARFDRAGSYVWHCHIIEHEDNDMMRPLEIIP